MPAFELMTEPQSVRYSALEPRKLITRRAESAGGPKDIGKSVAANVRYQGVQPTYTTSAYAQTRHHSARPVRRQALADAFDTRQWHG